MPPMKRIIAVANQKGGVGKTTTAVNLAASFAATRRRVLLIDIDPQGNATMGCGVEKSQITRGVGDVLLGDCDAASAIIQLESVPGLALMPSNQDLTAAEVRLLTTMAGRELRLRNALKQVQDQYEVIIIDCPPALNMLTLNALVAAQSVLIPMQCEYYALEGLSALVSTIDQIKAGNFNLDLKNPHNPDTGPGDVDHLLPEYEKLLTQIAATRAKLKQELRHALTATAGTAE